MLAFPRNVIRSAAPREILVRVVESVSTLPSPLHNPGLTLRWIGLVARRRYLMLVVVILAGTIAVVLGDAVLERVFSGRSKTEHFTGIFGATSAGERRRQAASRALRIVVWVSGIGVATVRFLLDAPESVSRAASPGDSSPKGRGAERVAGRFEIIEQIGKGATGSVYRATDTVLERPVALKELSLAVTDGDTRQRFQREARILARLNHPGIVQIYDFIEHRDRVWIAMELVAGGDLATLMRKRRQFTASTVASLGAQMAEALAFAHEHNVVHRDLKPLNILLVDEDSIKITDFGLAKLAGASVHTIEGTILGSPHYMSPEQADGCPVDALSDIYSLGAVLYHMLCGRPPFEGELASVLMQHMRRAPVPPGEIVNGVPANLERLVLQALLKNPSERICDMETFARELKTCLETVS